MQLSQMLERFVTDLQGFQENLIITILSKEKNVYFFVNAIDNDNTSGGDVGRVFLNMKIFVKILYYNFQHD